MEISPERWDRLRPIVIAALELPPERLTEYLDRVCGEDRDLRRETELLVRACREADAALPFLESSAAELGAPLLVRGEGGMSSGQELRPGTTLGSYTIERRLGSGGMGVVYLARDERLDRSVALKLLPPWVGGWPTAEQRFIQEAKAASRRDHPNIETIYEFGETADGRLFIAMAYYEGDTLRQRIASGPLDRDMALEIAAQIADGLGAAHATGVVHRDIKPGNVIVTPEGVAKILDFGAAKLAGQRVTEMGMGSAPGTVAYMSPEQTRQEEVGPASDVWSLGVVLYEMLTGRHPFSAQGSTAVIQAIRNDGPAPLRDSDVDLPESLVSVVERCLRKDPVDRYRDGGELAAELREVQGRIRGGTVTTRRRPPVRRRRTGLAWAAALVPLLALALVPVLSDGDATAPDETSRIAVLPFGTVADDSTLERLGRELVVTLSASLASVGIPTVESPTVLSRLADEADLPQERKADVARGLGAGRFLDGTLVRTPGGLRVEITLFDASDRRPLVRASVRGSADDIGALTDSATLAILRPIWQEGELPAPNLAALTTRSLPALRAYLQGELAFARAEYREAVRAFERAFDADSTFWLAYLRSLYPRVYEGGRPDSAILARLVAHRDRLPEPDRLLVEAEMAERLGARLERLGAVTRRFSRYWPAWYAYADELVHHGPYLGWTHSDAQAALERLVELQPEFAAGWQHLLWIGFLRRDTLLADRALVELERFEAPDAFRLDPANMDFFRAIHGLLRSGGSFPETVTDRLAEIALAVSPPVPPEAIATTALSYGFPAAQLQQIRGLLDHDPPPRLAEAQRMGRAHAWAARGAWDSAFVAMEEWVRRSDDPRTRLRAYGLGVLGSSLGAIAPETVAAWRPGSEGLSTAAGPDEQAELTWLDGILAFVRGDVAGLARSHVEIRRIGSEHSALLDASLAAFRQRAAGDRREAAFKLAALVWDIAERGTHEGAALSHPYLSAIHRPTAARWILETGDTLQASRLLTWHEAIVGARVTAGNKVAEPIALYQRGRLAEARGRFEEARAHYRGFLERYDLPPPTHTDWRTQAMVALSRLAEGVPDP